MSSHLSDLNLRRIRQSHPGGTWRDWDNELLAECHRRECCNILNPIISPNLTGTALPIIFPIFLNERLFPQLKTYSGGNV